ncbi:MAG: pilus assembly protein PilO [Acaryochloridaceae cyanobacterium RU_4_10]|nr:pilus assembly protein PilO [Acaryochloridaceae cyanobacterium RU_4_10]
MTISDRFPPGEGDFGGPAYPTAFGVTFTPSISGVLIGLAGVALAGWMAVNFIGPKLSEMQGLRDRIAEKEQSLQQKQQTVREVQNIIARVNEAKAKNTEVRGLFSNQQALDTLLLDLNRIIVSSKAELQKFTPDYATSGILADGSLGSELNNKLKRQVTDVAFEGNFNQTLEIMRAIDRLQTVLVLRDFKMELKADSSDKSAGPKNIVTSNFKLYAYVPLSEEESAAAAKAAAAAAAAKPADGAPAPN